MRLIRLLAAVCLFANTLTTRAADAPKIVADVVYGHKDGMALTYDVIKPGR